MPSAPTVPETSRSLAPSPRPPVIAGPESSRQWTGIGGIATGAVGFVANGAWLFDPPPDAAVVFSDHVVGLAGNPGLVFVATMAAAGCAALVRGSREARRREQLQQEKHATERRLTTALAAAEAETKALRESEARYRASEARFAAIFHSNPIATSLSRVSDGRLVDLNQAYLMMAGFTRDQVIGQECVGLGLWRDAAERNAMIAAIRQGGAQTLEALVTWKSGASRSVVVTFELIEIEGAEFLLGMWRDITVRRRVQADLRASEERFRELVESISEVFWVAEEPGHRLAYVSPNFARIWGAPLLEIGQTRLAWLRTVHRDDLGRIIAAVRQMAQGFDETVRIRRADGEQRWIRARAFAARDGHGTLRRVVGVIEDITEKKQLEARFLHAQRLEAVGTLASGVAHEMNNILAPFMVVPDLLKGSCAAPEERELLRMLEETAHRGSGIVKQLLAFSRGSDTEYAPVALESLIDDLVQMIRATFPRGITVAREMPAALPAVIGNSTQIHQVLLNLCLNARDAMPTGGRLGIRAQEVEINGHLRLHPEARPGRYVAIGISDSGGGIPPEIFARIFDPFFTTKQRGAGTGLGLSTASSIVKNHEGFITVDSEVGNGSEFRVYLPVSDQPRAALENAACAGMARGAGELILVVDDEEPVRTTLGHLLDQHGFRVLTAGDGQQALRVVAEHAATLRLLITDFMMPNVNGAALMRDVRRIAPTLPIIAMTGTVDTQERQQLESLALGQVLAKPFGSREIIEAVRLCIGQSS